ncbi:hypothetical protein L1D14_07310 [Vibrio tubiashii]|uniref:hypothetical protein n=1 Tax=Vibrio tubiashii TaxID=29498 RepID=UPI001EFC9936|nr:hypothetical protein [Vibrio tubiashii]MCG9576045.1 hypothetical protein [Vibrio tubiashii]
MQQQNLPQPGDLVFMLSGPRLGDFGIISGSHQAYTTKTEVEVCFSKQAHRSKTGVSVSGGPSVTLPSDALTNANFTRTQEFIVWHSGSTGFDREKQDVAVWYGRCDNDSCTYDELADIQHYIERTRAYHSALEELRVEVSNLNPDYQREFKLIRGNHVVFEHKFNLYRENYFDADGQFTGKEIEADHIAQTTLQCHANFTCVKATFCGDDPRLSDYANTASFLPLGKSSGGKRTFGTHQMLQDCLAAYGYVKTGKQDDYGNDLYRPEPTKMKPLQLVYQ